MLTHCSHSLPLSLSLTSTHTHTHTHTSMAVSVQWQGRSVGEAGLPLSLSHITPHTHAQTHIHTHTHTIREGVWGRQGVRSFSSHVSMSRGRDAEMPSSAHGCSSDGGTMEFVPT